MSTRITGASPLIYPEQSYPHAICGRDINLFSLPPQVTVYEQERSKQISTVINVTTDQQLPRNVEGKVRLRERLSTELNYLWLLSKPQHAGGPPILRIGIEENPTDPSKKLGHPALFAPGESKDGIVGGELHQQREKFVVNKKTTRYPGDTLALKMLGVQPELANMHLLGAAKQAFHAQTDLVLDGSVEPRSRPGTSTTSVELVPKQETSVPLKVNFNNARRNVIEAMGGQRALDHALRRVAKQGDTEAIHKYLVRGANPNAFSIAGKTAVHLAVESLNPDALSEVLFASEREKHLQNSRDPHAAKTTTIIAGDPNIQRTKDKKTPLHLITEKKGDFGMQKVPSEYADMAAILLNSQSINTELKDVRGKAPRDLVSRPADIDSVWSEDDRAILAEANQGQQEVYDALHQTPDSRQNADQTEQDKKQNDAPINNWLEALPSKKEKLIPPLEE